MPNDAVLNRLESLFLAQERRTVQPSQRVGTFSIGGISCSIDCPFPEWKATMDAAHAPVSHGWDKRLRQLREFRSSSRQDFKTRVYRDPGIRRQAHALFDAMPPSAPGRELRTLWHDGTCHIVQVGLLGRYRSQARELDVVVPTVRNFNSVESSVKFVTAELVAERGGFLLHAAGLCDGDQGIAFYGPSGSGKSTIATLARAQHLLSDETLIVRPEAGRWSCYGTPFSGSSGLPGENHRCDLRALVRLLKAPDFKLERSISSGVLSSLMRCVVVLDDAAYYKNLVSRNCLAAAASIPIYELKFRPESQVWPFVRGEMGLA
jgi:hypothetical protein